jgi:hypothetical protein
VESKAIEKLGHSHRCILCIDSNVSNPSTDLIYHYINCPGSSFVTLGVLLSSYP